MVDIPRNERILLKRIYDVFANYEHYVLPALIAILFVIGVIASRYLTTYPNKPICPFDFRDRSERYNSFVKWENDFSKNNPNANISDLAKARKNFYIENKCLEAIYQPNPKDYGIEQVDETTQQLLDIIENYNLDSK